MYMETLQSELVYKNIIILCVLYIYIHSCIYICIFKHTCSFTKMFANNTRRLLLMRKKYEKHNIIHYLFSKLVLKWRPVTGSMEYIFILIHYYTIYYIIIYTPIPKISAGLRNVASLDFE